MDKKTEKQLLGALDRLKETSRKMKQQKELKNWSEISVPFSLKNALERLSKDELSDIRKRLEIKSASHLKKGDLIELLSMSIPDLLEKIFVNMDLEPYNIVKKIIHNGGYIEEPKLDAHQLAYFRKYGIIFTGTYEGKKIVAMPEELVKHQFIQEYDKQFMSICRRNTEWIKLTQGLLYYYGTLTIQELFDLLKKYSKEPISIYDYLTVMEVASSYYKQIRMDHIGYSNIRVFDSEKVKREHQMRKNLEFFPFSKEQLLKAGEPEYIERNEFYIQFVQFLTRNYEISNQEADDIVEECVYATRIGEGPNQILQFLQSRLEFESIDAIRACMDVTINLMNNTRQWFLKGFSPKELSAHEQKTLHPLPNNKKNIIDFKTRKKISRNAPCPCGSNKKYKHCCGR
jgi:SEC-C motif